MIQSEVSGQSASGEGFARRVSLRAHFGSRARAERAARSLAGHARSVHVSAGHSPPSWAARTVPGEEVARVKLVRPHWPAFAAGLAIGTVALQFLLPDLLAAGRVGLASATELVKAAFALVGIAFAVAWLKVAFGRFVRRPLWTAGYELQAEVLRPTLGDAEQALHATGAVVVWVLGDEPLPAAGPTD